MIYLNEKLVRVEKFPNGESLIKLQNLEIKEKNQLFLKFEGDSDIATLIFIKSFLDEKNVKAILKIPYLPYSRMDRTEGVTIFTLKYLAKIINGLNFEKVIIYEPHSDVSVALLDRVEVVNMTSILTKKVLNSLKEKENIYLVYPDAGAEKRYSKQIEYDRVLTGSKERDFNTGYIKKLDIIGEIKDKNFNCVIVDDLCSKGGTFILTAKKLKELGANKIYLVVTHCEDSIFEGDIIKNDIIEKVYTTDSILSKEDKKIIIEKL